MGNKISAEKARIKAESEYEKFRVIQDKNYVSDFDNEIQRFLENENEEACTIQAEPQIKPLSKAK